MRRDALHLGFAGAILAVAAAGAGAVAAEPPASKPAPAPAPAPAAPGASAPRTRPNAPAAQVLSLLMQQASPDQDLVYESTPWFMQVMTKTEANRHPVVRIYDVGDLIHEIPDEVGGAGGGLTNAGTVGGGRSNGSSV